jgi:hypothetical protein
MKFPSQNAYIRIRHTPVFKDINAIGPCEAMRRMFILAIIAAVCICSNPDSGTMKLEEEDENSKLSCCAEDKTNTSMPGQWSQADQRYYNNFRKKLKGAKGHELDKMVERAENETMEIELLLRRLTYQGGPSFIPEEKDRALARSFLCNILGMGEDISDDMIKRMLREVDTFQFSSPSYRDSMKSRVEDMVHIMDRLGSRVLGWSWSWP